MTKKTFLTVALALMAVTATLAQQRSAKRGIGWDEKTQTLTSAPVEKMAPGVSWVYNWAATPKSAPANLGPDGAMAFVPMAWNGGFNEAALRQYLTSHPGVRWLLGFNEPNFSSQASMTPAQAVAAWPKLEAVARDFGLQLVAPALNFTGEKVGGRTWSPFEWYDEFFRLYPTAQVDYLAFHCYMNWAENVDWIASRYFYTDKGSSDLYTAANREKYPNLVKYLDDFKAANGHFPQMFLTEFCSWESNVYPYASGLTRDFQTDQMTQKVQYLEQSDLVAGYAWFMANPSGGDGEFPYMSVFKTNTAASELSDLGRVYVYMSAFDKEKRYVPGEPIMAKDYIDASMDDAQVKVRPSTDQGSDAPLQIELQKSTWVAWQVSVPAAGTYTLRLRLKSAANNVVRVCMDELGQEQLKATVPSTGGTWTDVQLQVPLAAGEHRLLLRNTTNTSFFLTLLQLDAGPSAVGAVQTDAAPSSAAFMLDGRPVPSQPRSGVYVRDGRKVAVSR